MIARVTRARPSEVAAVFAIVLAVAFLVVRVRLRVLGPAQGDTFSCVVIAFVATLVFWALRTVAGPALARASVALLLLILACSVLAAMARVRLDPVGVLPRIPMPLHAIPEGLVRIANWPTDQPRTWAVHEPAITFGPDARIRVDGTPEVAYSYLAVSNPQRLARDTYIVVEGFIRTGGLSIGLQRAGRWTTSTTIQRSGPFRIWVVVPSDDDFQLVLAYATVAHTPTHAELASLTLWR